jgi:hypothetical protein
MKITRKQLRKIIREELIREFSKEKEWPKEYEGEIPADIQKQADENEKMGIPSTVVQDPETGEWRVEELN